MNIRMRIIQRFDAAKEKEFLKFEKLFADLEASRPDFPKGKRLLPISASEPCNTLIWECDFPDIETAYETLDFFSEDAEHEALYEKQAPFFEQVKIEFYKIF